MSLESEEQSAPAPTIESKHESQKFRQSRISYTRDFLLSLCELDICKRLPAGFDASVILSELEDASQNETERQRIPGGLSLQRYGSTPLNRADNSSYTRGSHGRWDTRSSGSNDRDGDSLSDRDSVTQDSGKRYGNQSRRTWQHPEHDGLLGSGAFPRPSGYTGSSAPRARGNDHYQLSRTSEPYHPPRPYKALPHSWQDGTDSRNDETFGSTEFSNEDKAEEERKRRVSFELMRKEQQKALQEKQKHPDKHKELMDSDIAALLGNSEDKKNDWSKTDNQLEDCVTSVSLGESVKSCTPAPASRPLVPPGFANTLLEKNIVKSSAPSPAVEVCNIGFEDNTQTKSNGSGNNQENEKKLTACMPSHEQKYEILNVVPSIDANEKTPVPSADAEASNRSFSFESSSYKSSSLLETKEGWADSAVANFDTEKVAKFEAVNTVGQDQSTSILEQLLGNVSTVNGVGSPSFVEHDDTKSDGDTWNTSPSHASKFAHWFLDEEKKPVEDTSSSKARDLLSLIVSHGNGGSQLFIDSDVKSIDKIPSVFPFGSTEVAHELITSTSATSATAGVLEPFHHQDKADVHSGVLTCEDLEQSILAEVKDSSSTVQHSMQGAWNFLDAKVDPEKAEVDDHASQHLLSLLQKGAVSKVPSSAPNHDIGCTDELGVLDVKSAVGIAENFHNTEKTPTLETLFGMAFMKELHSVEAPVSAQRGSVGGSARNDVPDPNGLPFSFADDGFFRSAVSEHAPSQMLQPDKINRHWFNFDDPRSKGSNLEVSGVFEDRGDGLPDIRLPEEESLIAVGESVHHETSQFMHAGNTRRTKEFISSETPVEIVDKLAALNTILKDERSMEFGSEGQPVFRGAYDPLESEISYQHLHGRPPSPQFPHQVNHPRAPFHSLDQHALRNLQMKFIGPENIHQDPHPAYPPSIFHHSFNGLGGPPRFELAHHSALQQLPVPGNFPPPHLLHGLPRGVPLPHAFNQMPRYVPELNAMQRFPLNHQQTNYGGLGMGTPGSGVGGANHPEALERLIEMELRGNQKQIPPVAAGHGPGIYDPGFDMAFRSR